MPTFRVKFTAPDAPEATVEAFKIGAYENRFRFRPMAVFETGETRLPNHGEWIVSSAGDEPMIYSDRGFWANHEVINGPAGR